MGSADGAFILFRQDLRQDPRHTTGTTKGTTMNIPITKPRAVKRSSAMEAAMFGVPLWGVGARGKIFRAAGIVI